MAHRRKRINPSQIESFLAHLKALPIDVATESPAELLELPALAQKHNLTNYDAAYVALAKRSALPLATADKQLRAAAQANGVRLSLVDM